MGERVVSEPPAAFFQQGALLGTMLEESAAGSPLLQWQARREW